MNQEIQKKYVSLNVALLKMAGIFLSGSIFYYFALIVHEEGLGLIIIILILLVPLGLLFVMLMFLFISKSVFSKSKRYIQTKFVDITFVCLCVVIILFASLISSRDIQVNQVGIFFMVMCVAIYLNHKFQKSETELGLVKS